MTASRPWSRRAAVLGAAGLASALTAAALPSPVPSRGARAIHLIGDSWAAGLHADPAHALGQVAAAALHAPVTVDAVSGSGYVNPAGAGTYLQRATATSSSPARLVIVQGGSNDHGAAPRALAAAVTGTIAALEERFPDAAILLLGPGPDPAPVTSAQRSIDRVIAAAARTAGIAYVSMLDEQWIPTEHLAAVIDPANDHPTARGQQYLGLRLAAAVRLLLPEALGT